jgi:hypothetical protein
MRRFTVVMMTAERSTPIIHMSEGRPSERMTEDEWSRRAR